MKRQQAALAKVTRPFVAGVFPRKRLFEVLDQMRDRPVVWVSGPPGCGKTTLIASYLDDRGVPCVWYQLDEGDTDPATFFYYMSLAVKKAAPRKRKPLPFLTPEYLPGLSTFTLRYFEGLYDRLKIPSCLVIDNYQEVPADSPLHNVFRHGLSHIAEGINVILVSRGEPPPVLTRMRANDMMEVVDWHELRLTLEESSGIVHLHAHKELSKDAIEYLHTTTDGWAAGLVLMLKMAWTEGVDPPVLGKLMPEEIFDYFAGESFDKTDDETQAFLLKTAFLPKMTAEMAEALTGLPAAGRTLSRLNRDNYFIERRFRSASSYQYHPLFREFLLGRAKETLLPETVETTVHHAATLLEEADQPEAAIDLLCDIAAWDAMVPLIMKHAPMMLAQGRNRPLQKWLGSLPKDLVENTPWLLYWTGAAQMPFDPSSSRLYFEQAFERLKAQGDQAGMVLAWSGTVDAIAYAHEGFAALDHWISVLEEHMKDLKTFPATEIEIRVAASMCSAMVHRQPQHPDLEAWGQRVLSSPQDPRTIGAKTQTLSFLAMHAQCVGDFEKALVFVKSLQELALSRSAGPLVQIGAKLGEAAYAQGMALHEACSKAVSVGLEISRRSGVHVLAPSLWGILISSTLDRGDCVTARELLNKMTASPGGLNPWDTAFLDFLKSREALLSGDFQQAALHAESALKLCTDVGSPWNISLTHLQKARVMYAVGRHGDATEHLEQALTVAREIKSKVLEFWALFLEAQFALDQGYEAAGLMCLRTALALGKDQQYLNTLVDQPAVTAKLCAKALEAGIEVSYVQNIIKKRDLIPDEPPVHLENWPWALKIFTLGRFELLKDEKPIRFSRKTQQKPLSLLKTLIAFGGRGVKEYQIADALWPEADGDMAGQSMATTLHRLRKLLGYHEAVELRDGRLTLAPRYCWVDVWAFERLLGQADTHWEEGLTDSAVELVRKAIDMYKGPLLARETEQPWMIPPRERLRSKFLRNIGRLGKHWQQVGRWGEALECYKKGLEVDSLAEELYQRLMTCYQQLDRRADAIAAYKKCRKVLSSLLGVEPSPKTEAIRESLLSEETP